VRSEAQGIKRLQDLLVLTGKRNGIYENGADVLAPTPLMFATEE